MSDLHVHSRFKENRQDAICLVGIFIRRGSGLSGLRFRVSVNGFVVQGIQFRYLGMGLMPSESPLKASKFEV